MERLLRHSIHWVAAWLMVVLGVSSSTQAADYLREVKPLLQRRCFSCHGALKQKSKLRLDTAALMRKGGSEGPAIVPGNSAGSHLIKRLTADGDDRMPPEGEALMAHEISLLRNWIDAGASAPANEKPQTNPRNHWAFKAPVRPTLPRVKDGDWVANPVDAFVLARLEQANLKPSPETKRRTLIRRLSLDLTGLPPTPAEVKAFLNDKRPDAYDRLVNRLLASPAFGERWGRLLLRRYWFCGVLVPFLRLMPPRI